MMAIIDYIRMVLVITFQMATVANIVLVILIVSCSIIITHQKFPDMTFGKYDIRRSKCVAYVEFTR